LYFRIGEVATLCRLPAYVLRFWESEFPQLKPVKSSTGQRSNRRRGRGKRSANQAAFFMNRGSRLWGRGSSCGSEMKTDKGIRDSIPRRSLPPRFRHTSARGLREILSLLSAKKTGVVRYPRGRTIFQLKPRQNLSACFLSELKDNVCALPVRYVSIERSAQPVAET